MNKIGYKLLAVTWVATTLSGCASVNDNPYYKAWHARAYEMRAVKDQINYQQSNQGYQQVSYSHATYNPMNNAGQAVLQPTNNVIAYTNMGNQQHNTYMNNQTGVQTPVDPSVYSVQDNPYQSYAEQSPYTTY
jgi:uncharacterized protein YceK